MDAEKAMAPVSRLRSMLDVSVSGYYAWKARSASRRQRQGLIFLAHMRGHFAWSNRTCGSPRIHADLKAQGLAIGRHRVARLMRDNGLRALQRRRFKRTTDSQHNNPVAPNLLEQDFTVTRPKQNGGSDISYIWTAEGWLYLAIVVDLYSRRIVGWAVGVRLRKELLWLPYKEPWSCAGRRRVWCSILIAAANIAPALTRRCCVMQHRHLDERQGKLLPHRDGRNRVQDPEGRTGLTNCLPVTPARRTGAWSLYRRLLQSILAAKLPVSSRKVYGLS
jgi:hypothetical protein